MSGQDFDTRLEQQGGPQADDNHTITLTDAADLSRDSAARDEATNCDRANDENGRTFVEDGEQTTSEQNDADNVQAATTTTILNVPEITKPILAIPVVQPLSSQDDPQSKSSTKSLNIAEFIGEIGFYQLSLTFLTLIRYVCVAMMTNTGPLIAPKLSHTCQLPAWLEPHINYPAATNHSAYLADKCHLDLKNGTQFECTHWLYDRTAHGITLTDTFELSCGRDWLRSAFQSSVSVGVTVASIVFGSFSDEHGRKLTLKISYTISLVAGLVSYWAPSFTIYTIARALCSMSDLGIVGSLYTIIVETFGNKYRGTICLIVFTGWSMGVMVMPYVTGFFMDFRKVMLFTVVCHIATLPWLMTIGESIRWLLVNGRTDEAEREIRRICKWNSVGELELTKIETKFQLSKAKYQLIAQRNELAKAKARESLVAEGKPSMGGVMSSKRVMRALFGGFFKVGQILKSRELTITTLVMVWTTFNSELLYMLFILINSDVGDNVTLNYAIGGLMEVLATLISIVMFARLTRRFSLSSTLSIISMSIFLLAFTHQEPQVSVWALNFTKFAISTLSSLIYVIVTELFPTSLRQTGMGLAATLGSFGAVIAPFIRTELTDTIGMTNVMLALCLLPLSAAILIPMHLRETKGLELADDVDEIV